MLKKLTILLFSLFLIAFNANAGSDGELALEKNKSEAQNTKDCFEKLNRATFAFNQGLDKAVIKPIAESYRKLPDKVQKGTSNAVKNLSNLVTIPNNVLQGDIKTAIINTDQLTDFNNIATISLNDIKKIESDSTATIRLIANKNNYNPSRLVYRTSNLKNTQLAVFSEIYYPKGWRVYIDGEEVDYFRVNYLLRGLMIPKGEHEVVFEFKPNSFYVGNKIALSSSIIFLITFFTVLVYYLKPGLLNNIYSSSEV